MRQDVNYDAMQCDGALALTEGNARIGVGFGQVLNSKLA